MLSSSRGIQGFVLFRLGIYMFLCFRGTVYENERIPLTAQLKIILKYQIKLLKGDDFRILELASINIYVSWRA